MIKLKRNWNSIGLAYEISANVFGEENIYIKSIFNPEGDREMVIKIKSKSANNITDFKKKFQELDDELFTKHKINIREIDILPDFYD